MESAVEQKLFTFLDKLGVTTTTYQHPPVFTVEESKEHCDHLKGAHTKNLFVRDKKKNFALVVVMEDRKLDLKSLAPLIGLGRLSFGSSQHLYDMLGVVPGSVTPFALVNAQVLPGTKPPLTVVLDQQMMAHETLNYHPLHNSATTSISSSGLLTFIEACGYTPQIIDLDLL